jgi:Lon protease-like protein
MNDDAWALEKFAGTARLFPLPNLVLFPQVVQPLHIFEERYRRMTSDALADDRLIATALIQAGASAEGQPPIHAVTCLGRIVADQELEDGRFLLLLRGLGRARVIEELDAGLPYRTARVEILTDVMTLPPGEARSARQRLADMILPRLSGGGTAEKQLRELFESEMPLGQLCDCLGYRLPLALPCKQKLLEEADVALRVQLLLDELTAILPATTGEPRKFPPDFSLN